VPATLIGQTGTNAPLRRDVLDDAKPVHFAKSEALQRGLTTRHAATHFAKFCDLSLQNDAKRLCDLLRHFAKSPDFTAFAP
jgi:hypothetical protein